jgi:hypothetical protein
MLVIAALLSAITQFLTYRRGAMFRFAGKPSPSDDPMAEIPAMALRLAAQVHPVLVDWMDEEFKRNKEAGALIAIAMSKALTAELVAQVFASAKPGRAQSALEHIANGIHGTIMNIARDPEVQAKFDDLKASKRRGN